MASNSPHMVEKANRANMDVDELVQVTVEANNGNMFKAAIQLGIYPNTVRYHSRRYHEKQLHERYDPLLACDKRTRWVIGKFVWDKSTVTHITLKLKVAGRIRGTVEPIHIAIEDAEEFLPIVNAPDTDDETLRSRASVL